MTLFGPGGPLGKRPAGTWSSPPPQGLVYVEPLGPRLRVIRAGATIVDTQAALLVHHAGSPPRLAIPLSDVTPGVGEPAPGVADHVHVDPARDDVWLEEEEALPFGIPRNPYHRVDCLASSRPLRVRVADRVLVDAATTVAVFETGLPPRLYVPRSVVRMDLLLPSDTTTFCPYKGVASYWSAAIDATLVEDVAWSYLDPRPECAAIAGMLSFYIERADVVADDSVGSS